MGKTKHNPPKKKEPEFIRFRKLQRSYLNEIRIRQLRELNNALDEIYEDLGIVEKMAEAPPGKYKLRPDFSGVDVFPVKPKPKGEPGSETDKETLENLVSSDISKGEGSKDN